MSKWIEWNGGECPVHPDTVVRVQFRCETRDEADLPGNDEKASELRWSHREGSLMNIIAYRVIKEHQPTIAETIREVAINWPKFLGDVECGVLDAFCDEEKWHYFLNHWSEEYQFQARIFMLLVSEALE